jgi:hypothetical protein
MSRNQHHDKYFPAQERKTCVAMDRELNLFASYDDTLSAGLRKS